MDADSRLHRRGVVNAVTLAVIVATAAIVAGAAYQIHQIRAHQRLEAANNSAYRGLVTKASQLGAPAAPVTIVVFGTYSCGFCAAFDHELDTLTARYPTQLSVRMLAFAPTQSREYLSWHLAALCAGDQGRYAEYNHAMFSGTKVLEKRDGWLLLADTVGIPDKPQFYGCVESRKYAGRIQEETALAKELGVEKTPTWFIGGRRYVGAPSLAVLDSLTRMTIAAASSSAASQQ